VSLNAVSPTALYGEHVKRLLDGLFAAHATGNRPLAVSAALFSWGDAAHAVLPSRLGA